MAAPWTASSQYADAESGFQYLRARYYEPATGQFLNDDPLVAITRAPYSYVNGGSLNSTDPSGQAFCLGPIHIGDCDSGPKDVERETRNRFFDVSSKALTVIYDITYYKAKFSKDTDRMAALQVASLVLNTSVDALRCMDFNHQAATCSRRWIDDIAKIAFIQNPCLNVLYDAIGRLLEYVVKQFDVVAYVLGK